MTDRLPLAQHTKAILDQLYADLDQARTLADPELHGRLTAAINALGKSETELATLRASVTRVRDLADRWVKAGPPPLGVPLARWWDARLAELCGAIRPAADESERTTPDNPPTSSDPHIYLSTGCYHGDHAYCQAMTGLNGAKRPASCKFCHAACQCPCHQQVEPALAPVEEAPAVSECGPACADQHAYDWTCALFAGVDDSDPADLTGYLAPDPPIGCLTITTEPTPSQRPDLHARLAGAIRTAACDGDCGMSELDCISQRIQPGVWHRGVVADVSGTPEMFASVVLTLLYQEWPWLRAEAEEREQQAATLAAITAEAARRGVVSIDGIRNIVKEQQ